MSDDVLDLNSCDVLLSLRSSNALAPNSKPPVVSVKCPACRHHGAFYSPRGMSDLTWEQLPGAQDANGRSRKTQIGIRLCPNPDCLALVFVVFRDGKLDRSYPAEVLDFDASDIPGHIAATLQEAITCHAVHCYKAAAFMVRRALEELCEERGVQGKSLQGRLKALETQVTLPKDLLDAVATMKLLSQNAAYVRAKDYNTVGKEEVELAIELTKDLLRNVYQYVGLVAKLIAFSQNGAEQRAQPVEAN
ncbi:MAG: DUF4145 domain-containing protein [Methyloligellaceae bacterium]